MKLRVVKGGRKSKGTPKTRYFYCVHCGYVTSGDPATTNFCEQCGIALDKSKRISAARMDRLQLQTHSTRVLRCVDPITK